MTHTQSVLQNVDGDAAVSGDKKTSETDMLHQAPPQMPGLQAPPRPHKDTPSREEREPKRPRTEQPQSQANYSDGKYSSNKKELDLCFGYNEGNSPTTNHQGRCIKNNDRVRQCWFCLPLIPDALALREAVPETRRRRAKERKRRERDEAKGGQRPVNGFLFSFIAFGGGRKRRGLRGRSYPEGPQT